MVFLRNILFSVFFLLLSQAMVSVQMLSELEEIIQFKLVPERREAIKRTWWNRLQVSCEQDLSLIVRIPSTRSAAW